MEPHARFGGCYEIVCKLGRGTTGVVYQAHHKALRRRVALKAPASGTGSEQFMRECRVLACLTSGPVRHIPALYEVMQHQGRPYYVRELVDGDTLEHRAASIAVRTGLALLAEVARVVEWVHGQGFAHRNLSAANVLVARDGTPRLIGFGRVGLLAGSHRVPAGASATPAEVDVRGLQDLLQWLYWALRQPVPRRLERIAVPGSVATAGAFAAAVVNHLQGGRAEPGGS